MKKFRFLDWKVYQDAKDLFALILKIVKKLPKEYRYELSSQIIRSALSVILNIAEGSGKESDKEINRYINISLGSLHETLACLDLLKDNRLISESDFKYLAEKITSISKQLGGFKKYLRC